MDPNLLPRSSESDKSVELSCSDSLPSSGSSSSGEADPKRRKVEGGEKNSDSGMEEGKHDKEDSSGEIDTDDDVDDDAIEVKQWTPKVRTLIKGIPEDDEGLQRYIRKINDTSASIWTKTLFSSTKCLLLQFTRSIFVVLRMPITSRISSAVSTM
ncbi:unnamed protein product [Linum trigynum]|uniref:Uncharacterized protein n=1 Tax=Linum trigynum TaxID=586398 RepID=A0AAV2FHC2_9ROSI